MEVDYRWNIDIEGWKRKRELLGGGLMLRWRIVCDVCKELQKNYHEPAINS